MVKALLHCISSYIRVLGLCDIFTIIKRFLNKSSRICTYARSFQGMQTLQCSIEVINPLNTGVALI